MAKRNILYRVMVYDSCGGVHCEYETTKESDAEDYAYRVVMKRENVQKFYIDERPLSSVSNKRRFIEDEDY